MLIRTLAQDMLRDREPARPATAVSRVVQVNGLRLHYLDYGAEGRTPMLCIHGGAAHAHWFDFVASGFTADHRVLSFDLRGHGDSQWSEPPYSYATYAADLAATVETLDLRNVTVIGHSMGGLVALVYAALYPSRVGRLVIVDSRMLMPVNNVAALREAGTRAARNYPSRDALIARYRLEPAGTQIAAPDVVHHMALHSGREQPDGTWQHKFDRRVFASFERLDGMSFWDRIKVPALLVKGEHSDRITPDILTGIRKNAPQTQMVEVAHADHHVMLDNPQGFIDAVRSFLLQAS